MTQQQLQKTTQEKVIGQEWEQDFGILNCWFFRQTLQRSMLQFLFLGELELSHLSAPSPGFCWGGRPRGISQVANMLLLKKLNHSL